MPIADLSRRDAVSDDPTPPPRPQHFGARRDAAHAGPGAGRDESCFGERGVKATGQPDLRHVHERQVLPIRLRQRAHHGAGQSDDLRCIGRRKRIPERLRGRGGGLSGRSGPSPRGPTQSQCRPPPFRQHPQRRPVRTDGDRVHRRSDHERIAAGVDADPRPVLRHGAHVEIIFREGDDHAARVPAGEHVPRDAEILRRRGTAPPVLANVERQPARTRRSLELAAHRRAVGDFARHDVRIAEDDHRDIAVCGRIAGVSRAGDRVVRVANALFKLWTDDHGQVQRVSDDARAWDVLGRCKESQPQLQCTKCGRHSHGRRQRSQNRGAISKGCHGRRDHDP